MNLAQELEVQEVTKNINTNRKNLVYLKYPHHGTQPYFLWEK